jgi:hypothetical protein
MMRFTHGIALTGILSTLCAGTALADTTYQFTVPVTLTLPSSYSGDRTLKVSCAIGGANITFDPASGKPSGGGDRMVTTDQPVTVKLNASDGSPTGGAADREATSPQKLTGSAAVTLTYKADPTGTGLTAGKVSTSGPTAYVCWGLVGTNSAYTTPPLVQGSLPVVAR